MSENLGHHAGPLPYTTRILVVFPAFYCIRGVGGGSVTDAIACGVQPGVLWVRGHDQQGAGGRRSHERTQQPLFIPTQALARRSGLARWRGCTDDEMEGEGAPASPDPLGAPFPYVAVRGPGERKTQNEP